ncbi:D-xylose transport system ATP-binding protein [Sporomusaceae bacterium BoRhaA]|uniref:xylose ABC transporter ATP-binding protein n=1 Tax=Pelorhabdus rhamnosifermentans TaxID=2772457 RepID=UPI001C0636D5|nr:xylose ABC transporter ATP-binding protein [Pelorhabdus rhamnosifermentans]MBU2700488.1 D-xylose transport system ATP-binding protein [Pelorhabdus rhamnosifermentans]
MSDYILEMKGIVKEFSGVRALNNVSFQVKRGEIHALCGENGAGKSTLMKVLSGVYVNGTYQGEIIFNQKQLVIRNITDAEQAGIAIIHQEMALFKELPVYENIFMGNELQSKGIINMPAMLAKTQELLNEMKLDISPYTIIKQLGTGQQQLVEIAKALAKHATLLILDEPTASLSEGEVEILVNILGRLKQKGVTCIYISHKLDEVFRFADAVTVIRDGQSIGSERVENVTKDDIVRMMVGREITDLYPKESHVTDEKVFYVKDFTLYDASEPDKKLVDNVSFHLNRGEVLGIAGLVGAGRTELVSAIYGFHAGKHSGEVYLNGEKLIINHPKDALDHGIAMVPEDRKRHGIIELMSVKQNMTLANIENYRSRFDGIDNCKELTNVNTYMKKLRIKAPSLDAILKNLSGGNQQKVVLAKYLLRKLTVLILDEPTRGIDVGAKYEIYNLINQLAAEGIAIIMISSDLPEVLGMADRILVMNEGRIRGEFINKNLDQEQIMHCAIGGATA